MTDHNLIIMVLLCNLIKLIIKKRGVITSNFLILLLIISDIENNYTVKFYSYYSLEYKDYEDYEDLIDLIGYHINKLYKKM